MRRTQIALPGAALAVLVVACLVAPSATADAGSFSAAADRLCARFYAHVNAYERRAGRHVIPDPTVFETRDAYVRFLRFVGTHSLATDRGLARLSVPAADRAVFARALRSDRAGGHYTLAFARRFAALTDPARLDRASKVYELRYARLEHGWDIGVAQLRLAACDGN